MTDYELLKKIFGTDFKNPIETDPEYADEWRADYETDYLLRDYSLLLVFDKQGKFKYYKTSY